MKWMNRSLHRHRDLKLRCMRKCTVDTDKWSERKCNSETRHCVNENLHLAKLIIQLSGCQCKLLWLEGRRDRWLVSAMPQQQPRAEVILTKAGKDRGREGSNIHPKSTSLYSDVELHFQKVLSLSPSFFQCYLKSCPLPGPALLRCPGNTWFSRCACFRVFVCPLWCL